jgi:hypothetical protein
VSIELPIPKIIQHPLRPLRQQSGVPQKRREQELLLEPEEMSLEEGEDPRARDQTASNGFLTNPLGEELRASVGSHPRLASSETAFLEICLSRTFVWLRDRSLVSQGKQQGVKLEVYQTEQVEKFLEPES